MREHRLATEEIGSAPALQGSGGGASPVLVPPLPEPAQRALTFGLALSAVRCTLQYVLLPFVLPWVGLAASIPPWVTLALGALALFAIVRNLRILWRMRHARRWSYLFVALVVVASLLVFAFVDVRTLFHL